MSAVPDKPQPPENWECCGGGSCSPCVWDRYYDELHQWNEKYGSSPATPANSVTSTEVDDDEAHFFR